MSGATIAASDSMKNFDCDSAFGVGLQQGECWGMLDTGEE
jgi:hypothetical protein